MQFLQELLHNIRCNFNESIVYQLVIVILILLYSDIIVFRLAEIKIKKMDDNFDTQAYNWIFWNEAKL